VGGGRGATTVPIGNGAMWDVGLCASFGYAEALARLFLPRSWVGVEGFEGYRLFFRKWPQPASTMYANRALWRPCPVLG